MKKCSCCLEIRPLSEYQTRRASKDGLTASCRRCLDLRDADRYKKEKTIRSLRQKAYSQTAEGKSAHTRAISKWKDAQSSRRAANVILGNAVKYGKVKKQPCWVCGCDAEAHHPDYDRPLDVVWLCRLHHREAHDLLK